MTDIIRSFGLVSDLHVGSPAAPWPEGFHAPQDEGGRPIDPSPAQQFLNSCWAGFVVELGRRDVKDILFAGDLVHGNNRRGWGRNVVTADLNLQTQALVKLITPACDDRGSFFVSGSEYHDGRDVRLESFAALLVGGEHLGYLANRPIAGAKDSKDRPHVLQIQHGANSPVLYKEMAMGRENLLLDAAEGRGKLKFHITVVVRGHWHTFVHMAGPDRHIIQLPGWTDWSPWKGALAFYAKMLPDIGGAILNFHEDGQITVDPMLFDRPAAADGLGETI